MRPLTCAATLRRLHAFHDLELPVADQIAVGAHLEWCDDCAAALAELRFVGAALRATAPSRMVVSSEAVESLERAIVSQVRTEREMSLVARGGLRFKDLHLVSASLGAAVVTLVCGLIVLGSMRLPTSERADSLAAFVSLLAAPGSNENPVAIDGRVRLPRALDGAFSAGNGQEEEDAVFALAAIVTREGRIANLELLHATSGQPVANEAKLVEGLLDAVSRTRFEPARVAGLPVAVNMVWLVAHTTVRGRTHGLDQPIVPPVKKRVVEVLGEDRSDLTVC